MSCTIRRSTSLPPSPSLSGRRSAWWDWSPMRRNQRISNFAGSCNSSATSISSICSGHERLDDGHAAAATRASARRRRCFGLAVGFGLRAVGPDLGRGERLAGALDVVRPNGAGEQAVMSDAVEAAGQHVQEKAADELGDVERHGLEPVAAFDPVVLPPPRCGPQRRERRRAMALQAPATSSTLRDARTVSNAAAMRRRLLLLAVPQRGRPPEASMSMA